MWCRSTQPTYRRYVKSGRNILNTAVICIGMADFENTICWQQLTAQAIVRRVIAKARRETQREILLQVGSRRVILLPEHETGRNSAAIFPP